MADSGSDFVRSISDGCDFVEEPTVICGLCEQEGKKEQAVGFCSDCKDYLCQICYDTHLGLKLARHHVLLDQHQILKEQGRDTDSLRSMLNSLSSTFNSLNSTLEGGSDFVYDYCCDLCEREGQQKEAVGYCSNCREYLCQDCYRHHTRPKPMRHHVLVDQHQMPKVHQTPTSPQKVTVTVYCVSLYRNSCCVRETLAHNVTGIHVGSRDDIMIPYITGCVVLPGDKLVSVDSCNRIVKLAHLICDVISHLDLFVGVWGITQVSSTQVAVTSPPEQKIFFISVGDVLEFDCEVKVEGHCYGIARIGNKLVVSYNKPVKVEIISLKGKVLKTVVTEDKGRELFTCPLYIAVSNDQQRIYISDRRRNTVTSFDLTGRVQATYKDDKLVRPCGLTVDVAGIVFVYGWRSHNILQLTADLTEILQLLQWSDGVQPPYSLCYSKATDRLYVEINHKTPTAPALELLNLVQPPPQQQHQHQQQQLLEEEEEETAVVNGETELEISGDIYAPPPPPPLGSTDFSLSGLSEPLTPRHDLRSSASGLNSNISTLSETRTDGSEDDTKRKSKVSKRYPVDKAYYIAKELLMTERTYKKDLEVITVWFKNSVGGEDSIPDYLVDLFKHLQPIYTFHVGFLREVEQRLSMWEGKSNAHLNGDYQRIGDIMVNSFLSSLGAYMNYLEKQDDILMDLDKAQKANKEFEFVYREFEAQKVCYLPLNTFLLKPGQRLLHYKLLLERLTRHYSKSHPDYLDCHATLMKLVELTQTFRTQRKCMENLQKLIELQRDLVGMDSLVHPDREFIREGCLQKFSRKGYQQRMFFLFSDMLVYTSRTATPLLQFKVHGQVPLRGMIIEESDHAKMAVANSFAIYGGNKCILVASSTQEEKDKWIEDLNESVALAKNRNDDKLKYASLKSSTSSSENIGGEGNGVESPPSPEKQIQHRANTTMHVCWHRNTSVCKRDHEKAVKNQLSGYLLRKFKNSNGWQKLWVVFTNFCLYFYKTYQDDFPLASLPLLGYAVGAPEDEDAIHKDHVFKLQFKNHVYFFRAESEYTFERWMEVINSATSSARRTRLFSRMDSSVQ